MMKLTRRNFFLTASGALAVVVASQAGLHWLCGATNISSIRDHLPANVVRYANKMRSLFVGVAKKDSSQLIANIKSQDICPRVNLLENIRESMIQDQRHERIQALDGWLVPNTAVDLAQLIVQST